MEYKQQPQAAPHVKPRLIIHGGAGNLKPANLPPKLYREYRETLLTIVSKTHAYMNTPTSTKTNNLPTALDTATFAVALLENNPLFNSAHGAVFTRDGLNELEASVMVSAGLAKRGVGVTGLRHIKNPILLARKILEHGDRDLGATTTATTSTELDVPSAQGHTILHGATAESLAQQYGLALVPPSYFFTQKRWDEHVRALERERNTDGGGMMVGSSSATWSKDEYLPQGTCGAVALDAEGVVCCATSTGGLTNKLTGRIGDTPVVGAGFWAEEWTEDGDPTGERMRNRLRRAPGPAVLLSDALRGLMAECLPTPFLYAPVGDGGRGGGVVTTTRSMAASGTGNGDSFLRTAAVRTVGSIARFAGVSSAEALARVVGVSGELEESAGDRWGRTGEGEGGMIGIESVVVRDAEGNVVETRSEILQDYNCGGMFRAWVDEQGVAFARIWRGDREEGDLELDRIDKDSLEDGRFWRNEKLR
ncbi:nucleophile aminohydrolase [Bombardia bombarda]|uniref:Nucleophile aminohydrolase n=1 Tax=Bombardia bombarda TaxID=252184 RepID=A0AA39X7K2_9PEZI|nr:nucleophile aminohydrolase [Bombardia bombarda]